MQCDVTGCISCISNKVEYLDKYIVIPSELYNATKKILDKFSFHRHFKSALFMAKD